MSSSVRVTALLLEDSDIDADLVASHLRRSHAHVALRRANGKTSFLQAIDDGGFAIILADYSLPDFDGLTALQVARQRHPDVPFIFVSGVVGEEFATDALKQGATDYVLKRNLSRLPTAVDRALAEAGERHNRRRAEQALMESNVRLHLAISASGIDTWDYTPATDEFAWTRSGDQQRDATCTTYEQFLARLPPIDAARLKAVLKQALSQPASDGFTTECRITQPDDSFRWYLVRGHGFFIDGTCTRLVGVLQDITDRKTAEIILRRQNRLLAREVRDRTRERDRIWQISRDLMIVCDFSTRPIAINPAWSEMLGWTESELIGRSFIELIHPDDRPGLRDIRLAENDTLRLEFRVRRKSGGTKVIAWTAVAQAGLVYAIGRDVTEERAAGRELAAANRQLVRQIEEREKVELALRQMQRLEAVGQLTSGVAHDFNNLLTVIMGNVAFLRRSMATTDPRLLRRLDHVHQAAQRGAKLTSQLLAFSRRQRLEPRPVDLNETVGGMHDLLHSTMGGAVQIRTQLEAALWPALVDPTQIELIILNLAINARDAMVVGGELTVSTSNESLATPPTRPEEPPEGDYVVLSVADTGTGMSEHVLQHAFEPFFTTKEVGRGSGLGLAQVFGIAKQSGGGVRIETQLGKGTTIHVLLPRAQADAGQPAATPLGADRRSRARAERQTTVLVVDDDTVVREVTADMLKDLGYEVVEAGSGGAALELLAQEPQIAVAVLDYAMPGMNGAEVAQELRKQRPGLPLIFITGYADLGALKGYNEDHIVQKPFQEPELAAKLCHALTSAAYLAHDRPRPEQAGA